MAWPSLRSRSLCGAKDVHHSVRLICYQLAMPPEKAQLLPSVPGDVSGVTQMGSD